jgi:PleD family two-component response regulator
VPEPENSPHPPLVLIANDQEWSARSLESILAPNGYTVLRAYTGQQALDRVRAARPDLVILDAQMPDLHGFEVCRQLRADPDLSATVPIIITTAGPSGRTQRLEAYRAGAWEFLGQPLDGESLLLKLQTFLAAKREADRQRADSLLDATSGLYNMRGLSRRAREIGSEVFRRHEALACVVFAPELDDGTPPPEPMAVRIGQLLREFGRASDAIGRLGQSEFAVIAPRTELEGARRLLDRLERLFGSHDIPGAESLRLRAGCCVMPDFAASTVDPIEMLLRATSALRQLSQEGGQERIRSWAPAAG